MEYSNIIQCIAVMFAAIMILVVLTNIFTQVIKKIVNRENCPAQVVVFLIAEILTIIAMVILCSILGMQILWYYWIMAIIVGVLVCYGAMFGYDNLYKQIGTAVKALLEAMYTKGE